MEKHVMPQPAPRHRYEVNRLEGEFGPVWTVVQWIDGEAKGGDHHWFAENFAQRAKMLYELDSSLFDLLPSELDDAWQERFGFEMFSPTVGISYKR